MRDIMKKKILDSTIAFIKKYNTYSEKEEKMLRYGLEGLYLTITKLIIILLLALALGILKEVIYVIIIFNIIRYFGFGFHAEKSYQCLIFSTICFVLIPFIFINTELAFEIELGIAGFCILNYLLFAPADTIKRPLPNKKKRLIRKILTIVVGCLYTLVIGVVNNCYLCDLLLSAMIIQAIIVNPITYKLFGQSYNNYKSLEQA